MAGAACGGWGGVGAGRRGGARAAPATAWAGGALVYLRFCFCCFCCFLPKGAGRRAPLPRKPTTKLHEAP